MKMINQLAQGLSLVEKSSLIVMVLFASSNVSPVLSQQNEKTILQSHQNFKFHEDPLFSKFYEFALKNKRDYIFNSSELATRFQVFKESLRSAEILNSAQEGVGSAIYGVTKFSDLTPQEFKDKYLSSLQRRQSLLKSSGVAANLPRSQTSNIPISALPKFVDWRQKSAVGPVSDQGACGACWAFSVTETMESMTKIQGLASKVPELSVQEMIDCDGTNKGCERGDICQAANWARKNGLVAAKDYPFKEHTGSCKRIPPSLKKVKVNTTECLNLEKDESEILRILASHGPVTVAVDATTWHNYVGGVIRFHCQDRINHAVQIVGYNLNGDVPYYIVRNSWGSDFGDQGYLYIKYGDNLCGIATEVEKLTVTLVQ